MSLCSFPQDWYVDLNVRGYQKQYAIRLIADVECCRILKVIQIFVNGVEIQHGLIDNPWSPQCGSTGRYQWQIDGHYFLLMANSTLACSQSKYRLFVDGIDWESGLEYSVFWRRRGWIFVGLGAALFIIGVIGLLLIFVFAVFKDSALRPAIVLIILGVFYFILGLIPVLKYRKPLVYDFSTYREPFSGFA